MFKKDLYTEVIRVLNLDAIVFKGGYMIAVYDGRPYVNEVSTLNAFDYVQTPVIPVAEEIAQETPSVNLADRSDYIFQYKIMFKSSRETEVLTALDAFRTYWLANKQVTIDGYVTGIKTSRGDKQGNIMIQNGEFYSFYTIKVFATAIKYGYIWKDTDKWEIRLKSITAGAFVIGKSYQIVTVGTTSFTGIGASANTVGVIFTATGVGTGTGTAIMTTTAIALPTTYATFKLDNDTFSTVGNVIQSNKSGKLKGTIGSTVSNSALRFFYNATQMEALIYKWCMNKLDRDTLFDIKNTFGSSTFEYVGLISSAVRTRTDNGVAIIDFNWIEADV